MNSARVHPSHPRYGRHVGVLSVSGRVAVSSRLFGAVGIRLVGAVGSRLAGAVGLTGFASPDVLKYRLAVLGVPVVDYSDIHPLYKGDKAFSFSLPRSIESLPRLEF